MQSSTVKKESTNKSIQDSLISDVFHSVPLTVQISFLEDLVNHYNTLPASPKLDVMNARRIRVEYWQSEITRMSQNL